MTTPSEQAEWLHQITLDGYGERFMECADMIRDLASRLGDCTDACNVWRAENANLQSKLDRIRELLQNCTEADEAWVASGVILTMLEQK